MYKRLPTHTTKDIFNVADLYMVEKVLIGNNVLIFPQMVHNQELGKPVVLLHMLKPLDQTALVASVIIQCQALTMKSIPDALKRML